MRRVGESMESKVQKVAGREVTAGNSNSHASHAIFGNNVDILEEILKHLDAKLQSLVATMGGFKRLYMNFLHPLRSYSHHKHCSSLNEDVIRLSLSLFSVDYYERRLESLRTSNASNFKIHSSSPPDSCTDMVEKSMKENQKGMFYVRPAVNNNGGFFLTSGL
ncbi:hypothetical protein SUGI_0256720 [Cryptomeria japonica]|nr:hypothetical protein SUGI_0256720 [Cryptomeria japonica]